MIRRKDYLDDLAKSKLAKQAYELGVEVGRHGHLDTAGWVGAELRHLVQEAEELRITDIVRRRYEFGKERGRVRRNNMLADASPASGGRVRAQGPEHKMDDAPPERADDRFPERVSAEEGIWSTISVMRYVRGDPDLEAHIGNLMASLVDTHDRIMQMPLESTPDKTFDSSLRLMNDIGWLTTYEVKFFDERSTMANIEATSLFARSFGTCDTPMCKPISNILETVGLKSFGRHVFAVEEGCMAQGKEHCTFKLFPREVPEDEGI